MGLEEVKGEIITKASEQAKSLHDEAEKEKEAILAKARNKAKTIKKEKEHWLKEELALLEKKADASKDLEMKKSVLTEKKKQIDETFEKTLEILEKTPKDRMEKILKKLLDRAGNEIDIGMVFCNKRDRDAINGKTSEKDISGGVIAEDNTGTVSVDLCFETLLEEYKEKHIEEISQMLFK